MLPTHASDRARRRGSVIAMAAGLTFAGLLGISAGSAYADPPPIVLKSQGARAFGGTNLYNPNDPTAYLPCDHGYVEWQIPLGMRKHPMVMTHGSGTRGYQTTFDGQPGFQSIYLRQRYGVFIVDLPRTGRAGQGCAEYTYTPNLNYNRIFTNRIGLWPPGEAEPEYFPGVAFSHDPDVLDQYLRIQYPEFNSLENEQVESDALAVLMEELYEEYDKPIYFSHSSGGTRSWWTAIKTDKIGAIITFEPAAMMFPEGEEPPPALRADGEMVPYNGRTVSLEDFRKLAQTPILIVWGDFIPWELDPINVGPRLSLDNRRISRERFILMVEALNRHGGNAKNLFLPDVGVTGNTHYPYADTNVNEVADAISQWIKEQGLDRQH